MATNQRNISLNRTLLILLGVLLAFLLTINAKPFYSADLLTTPGDENNTTAKVNPETPKIIIDQIGKISFENFIKKVTTLK